MFIENIVNFKILQSYYSIINNKHKCFLQGYLTWKYGSINNVPDRNINILRNAILFWFLKHIKLFNKRKEKLLDTLRKDDLQIIDLFDYFQLFIELFLLYVY